jgi:DNA-binding response OmpR family regulator
MSRHPRFQIIPLSEVPSKFTPSEFSRRPVVLVVDDEPLIADTLVAILCKQNYAASAAYSAEEALLVASVIPPEFLITDIMMPGMNGVELAISIKELTPDCKVLLFSGSAHAYQVLEDPSCARYDFPLLTKPIHPDVLLACISSLTATTAAA